MQKHQLAQELRERQYKAGHVERRLIDALSDDEMIDSYVTCSGCRERHVTEAEEAAAMTMAANSEQFLDICEDLAKKRHRRR